MGAMNTLAHAEKPLISGSRHRAHSGKAAPFLPMSRAEMTALGWDACDIVLVTGDAYVDHPSFGMAIIGRLLEAQGFRVGIIAQPDWQSAEPFKALGKPTVFFGVTGGNMDSMVNRYTADRRLRHDDAYTPGGEGGQRPDRCTLVYAQRCREAFKDVPIVLGGIEASLRRIAHFDYWSEKVRRSVLADAKADLLLYGNAERAVVEVAQPARRRRGAARSRLHPGRRAVPPRARPLHRTARRRSRLRRRGRGPPPRRRRDPAAGLRAGRAGPRGLCPRLARAAPGEQSRQCAAARPAPRRPRPVAEPAADPADHRRDGFRLRSALRARAASLLRRREDPGLGHDQVLGDHHARLLRRLHVLLDHRARGPHHPEPLGGLDPARDRADPRQDAGVHRRDLRHRRADRQHVPDGVQGSEGRSGVPAAVLRVPRHLPEPEHLARRSDPPLSQGARGEGRQEGDGRFRRALRPRGEEPRIRRGARHPSRRRLSEDRARAYRARPARQDDEAGDRRPTTASRRCSTPLRRRPARNIT